MNWPRRESDWSTIITFSKLRKHQWPQDARRTLMTCESAWNKVGRRLNTPLNSLGPDGLIDNWTSGPTPRQLPDQLAEFAKIAEAGPNHEVDGVVRWRRIDPQARHPDKFSVEFHGQPDPDCGRKRP
jgi:hypothetical protein